MGEMMSFPWFIFSVLVDTVKVRDQWLHNMWDARWNETKIEMRTIKLLIPWTQYDSLDNVSDDKIQQE